MAYQVLARKWRPKSFEELIGQESTVIALKNALDQNRLHHAYLFNGTRGVGKTTLARILAKALDCEKGTSSQPCLKCNTCQEIDTGRYVDLVELDAASNTQVDNMRDLLENAQYAPSSGKFKIYIIDEVHMLSKSAFNAMLKTLEEPPEHVKFILATTEPNKVPITILSRCLQFDLKAMTQENISTHLESILDKEKIEFDKEATKIIAKAGAGSMRDALSLLDQALAFSGNRLDADKTHEMFGTINDEIIIKMLSYITNNNAEELLNLSNDICKKNISIENIL
ncbi:MAG: DNA polymerase III subunit gamma/tau, partial [Methylophilaceae bacterium]